jgi:hypothetical protein
MADERVDSKVDRTAAMTVATKALQMAMTTAA